MMRNRMIFLAVMLLFIGIGTYAHAQIVLNSTSDISFGTIEYQTSHAGTISIGTNGALTITGTGMTYDSGSSPGQVTVNATPSSGVIEIKCTDTAKLKATNGNNTLDVDSVEVTVNSVAVFGGGNACQGTRKKDPVASTFDITGVPTITIYLGGRVQIPSGALANGSSTDTYSGANTGGKTVTLRVLFQ